MQISAELSLHAATGERFHTAPTSNDFGMLDGPGKERHTAVKRDPAKESRKRKASRDARKRNRK